VEEHEPVVESCVNERIRHVREHEQLSYVDAEVQAPAETPIAMELAVVNDGQECREPWITAGCREEGYVFATLMMTCLLHVASEYQCGLERNLSREMLKNKHSDIQMMPGVEWVITLRNPSFIPDFRASVRLGNTTNWYIVVSVGCIVKSFLIASGLPEGGVRYGRLGVDAPSPREWIYVRPRRLTGCAK
jgi:hypothetical protein